MSKFMQGNATRCFTRSSVGEYNYMNFITLTKIETQP